MKFSPRKFLADTFSMTTFGLVVGGLNELLIAGLNGKEFLKARAISASPNLLTGRPYGIYRDWVFDKCGGEITGRYVRNGIIEIGAFASFQAPVYVATLTLAGANYDEISKAVTSVTLMTPFVARPCGIYMEKVRGAVGVRG